MKKYAFLYALLLCIVLSLHAQEASGECKLPSSYDYIRVLYFNDGMNGGARVGHLSVSNQSGIIVTSLHVKVEMTHTWEEKSVSRGQRINSAGVAEEYENVHWNKKKATAVLIDDDINDIPPFKTTIYETTSRGRIKGGPHSKDSEDKRNHHYEYRCIVNNLMCSPIEE